MPENFGLVGDTGVRLALRLDVVTAVVRSTPGAQTRQEMGWQDAEIETARDRARPRALGRTPEGLQGRPATAVSPIGTQLNRPLAVQTAIRTLVLQFQNGASAPH